jgi:hypothetical protein
VSKPLAGEPLEVETSKSGMGAGGPVAGPDQSVNLIELPKELESVTNVDELHRKIGIHVKK